MGCAGGVAPLAPLPGVVAFWLVLARCAAVVRRGAGGCALRFFLLARGGLGGRVVFLFSWRALRGCRCACLVVALRFFSWCAPRAGGARACLLRCVFFLGARRGRAVRVLVCCAAFFFLVRAAGVRRACLVVALRFFSWCVPRACCARAWLLRCVFFLGARRGRALRVLGCCSAFFIARAAGGRRACAAFALCFFFAGARRGRCVCAASVMRFFFWRVSLAGGVLVLLPRCVFFLARVAGGRCACAASAVRFFIGVRRGRCARAAAALRFFGARRWRCWRPALALRFFFWGGRSVLCAGAASAPVFLAVFASGGRFLVLLPLAGRHQIQKRPGIDPPALRA